MDDMFHFMIGLVDRFRGYAAEVAEEGKALCEGSKAPREAPEPVEEPATAPVREPVEAPVEVEERHFQLAPLRQQPGLTHVEVDHPRIGHRRGLRLPLPTPVFHCKTLTDPVRRFLGVCRRKELKLQVPTLAQPLARTRHIFAVILGPTAPVRVPVVVDIQIPYLILWLAYKGHSCAV